LGSKSKHAVWFVYLVLAVSTKPIEVPVFHMALSGVRLIVELIEHVSIFLRQKHSKCTIKG
jgi:hypothetical protein